MIKLLQILDQYLPSISAQKCVFISRTNKKITTSFLKIYFQFKTQFLNNLISILLQYVSFLFQLSLEIIKNNLFILQFQHNYVNEDENMLMKFLGSEYAENFRIVHSLLHEVFPCKFVKEVIFIYLIIEAVTFYFKFYRKNFIQIIVCNRRRFKEVVCFDRPERTRNRNKCL